jgi:RNA polymerase sigma factor (sigma-70 family)
MNGQAATTDNDPRLQPFLSARAEAEVEQALSRLLSEHAEPVIRSIISRKLPSARRGGYDPAGGEADDVCQEALVQLLGRLQRLRADPAANHIGNFQSYVAVIAFNVCHAYLRRKYPRRRLLKNRVRYLLTNWENFAAWEDARQEWLCGFAAWRELGMEPATDEQLQQLCDEPRLLAASGLSPEGAREAHLVELLGAIFQHLRRPVELDALVNTVAEIQQVKDQPNASTFEGDEEAGVAERLPDPRADVADEVDQRLYLQRLWAELCALPPRQRAALLLNLKTTQEGVIGLLPVVGVASIRQIAEAVSMPAEEFARLWNDLPLDDAAIAARLGLTRQQVINLRKSARERLRRRMRDESSTRR